MQTLLLKTDDLIFQQIKDFLQLLPKERVEVIDPFEIGVIDEAEQQEIMEILNQSETREIVADSKRVYDL